MKWLIKLLAYLSLLCVAYMILIRDLEHTSLSNLINFTMFSSVIIALLVDKVIDYTLKVVENRLEDKKKLTTEYEKLVERYKPRGKLFVAQSSDEEGKTFPAIVYNLENSTQRIQIIDDDCKQYSMPFLLIEHYSELMSAHRTSDLKNNQMIRVDNACLSDTGLTLRTSRTMYFDSMVANRAMDFECSDGFKVRDYYAQGLRDIELSKSLLSNHLGVGGFILTADEKVVFIDGRQGTFSIGKRIYQQSFGAAVHPSKFGKFTEEDLTDSVRQTLRRELALDCGDYDPAQLQTPKYFYIDLLEGCKPQLLYFVALHNLSSDDLQERFSKGFKEREDIDFRPDGKKLDFKSFDVVTRAVVDLGEIDFSEPQGANKRRAVKKVLPSTALSTLLLQEYLRGQ